MNYAQIANTIREYDHNIVWAMENMSIHDQVSFIPDALSMFELTDKQLESAKTDITDIDAERFKTTLHQQLPHIVWMIQDRGTSYYGLSVIFRSMAEHDMIYKPSDKPPAPIKPWVQHKDIT